MSSLREVLEDYLWMRRALGYKLEAPGRQLHQFVSLPRADRRSDDHDRERGRVGDAACERGPVVLGRAVVGGAPVRPSPANARPGL